MSGFESGQPVTASDEFQSATAEDAETVPPHDSPATENRVMASDDFQAVTVEAAETGIPLDLFALHDDSFDPPMQSGANASSSADHMSGEPGGFRARWKARFSADDPPGIDEVVSVDQTSDSQTSWHVVQSSDKRRRVQAPVTEITETTASPAVSASAVAELARLEALSRFRSHAILMPWEKGPLAPIFGSPAAAFPKTNSLTAPLIGLVDTLSPLASAQQHTPQSFGPVSKFAKKRIASAKFTVPENEMLGRCLNQIKTVLLLDLEATEVGTTLCNVAGTLDENLDVLQILRDCFARKATATILKRTSAFWSLSAWLLTNEGTPVWSITENQLYKFVCFLRDSQAAATRASSVLESINFFHSTLRFKRVGPKQLMSSRVMGAAHTMYLGKRKLQQAPQLTVEAVRALELTCIAESSLLQTVVSGALLFCVFSCARWSDFSRLEGLWSERYGDLVLVEGETAKHKTSKSKESQTRLLPFMALGNFMEEKSWGECFVSAWDQIRETTQQTFLPSWNDRGGSWATSPMVTAEATLFLREFLYLHGMIVEDPGPPHRW
eukprot:s1743_g24.t1